MKAQIATKAASFAAQYTPPAVQSPLQAIGFNNGVSIYPTNRDQTYIRNGYNKNAAVYSIVSKCAKKFGQVPWYHYKIKAKERKTWFEEYLPLTKDRLNDPLALIEAKRMRLKSVDQVAVDSPLSKILHKANRNQSGSAYREQLYGYKLLTGEGNTWFSRLDKNVPPSEMFIIPKPNLLLVQGHNPWDIAKYQLKLNGKLFDNEKENILMWAFPNYEFNETTLTHLRGMSPLDAGLLLMQSSNEANERMIAMNKNQGVAGMVYDKGKRDYPTTTQASFIRSQFDDIVNDSDLAGSIAYMTGDLGFFQFGLDAGQLKLLEQSDVHFKGLCNIYDVPWQLFGNNDAYENRKQYKRDFIYDNIAPAAYSLRDEMNAKLIREFNLDRERDVIDCDVLSLPELSQDQQKTAEFIDKMGGRLTFNEGRELLGWERSTNPDLDKHYVQAGLTPLDQLNADLGGNLNAAEDSLNA